MKGERRRDALMTPRDDGGLTTFLEKQSTDGGDNVLKARQIEINRSEKWYIKVPKV